MELAGGAPPPTHRIRGRRLATVALVVASLGIGACGDDEAAPTPPATAEERPAAAEPAAGAASAEAALVDDRAVIDVRTAEEYDAGHVDGARRIGLADADFAERVAELDPDTAYVVYCRTGNRSAQAATAMRTAGLDVVDGGAFDDMVAAGWPAA